MDRLQSQAQRLAESRYTRSAQRAKWTRLAGQLLWYKDQILRAMTWEALEQELNQLERRVYEDRLEAQRSDIIRQMSPIRFTPTPVKKREEGSEGEEAAESDHVDSANQQ